MMVTATIDTSDVVGATLSAGAPVKADGVDFAAMMAMAGKGLADGSGVSAKAPDAAWPQSPIEDLPNPVDAGDSAKGHTKVTPRIRPVGDEAAAAFDMPSPVDADADLSRNETYPKVAVDAFVEGCPAIRAAEMQSMCLAQAPTKVATNGSNVKPVDEIAKQPSAEKPVKAVVDDPAILVVDRPVAIATAPLLNDVPPPASKARRADSSAATVAPRAVADPSPPPVVLEVLSPVVERKVDQPDPIVAVVGEQRIPTQLLPIIDKAVPPTPERLPVFAAQIADVARDVLSLTKNNDVRFNVRPETLGPVSVIIERGDAGSSLRLGVETSAQVQAVRQAEPMLNDGRGGSPFVQVTVDLNSPDARSKPARAAMPTRRARLDSHEIMMPQPPVITGRYA